MSQFGTSAFEALIGKVSNHTEACYVPKDRSDMEVLVIFSAALPLFVKEAQA